MSRFFQQPQTISKSKLRKKQVKHELDLSQIVIIFQKREDNIHSMSRQTTQLIVPSKNFEVYHYIFGSLVVEKCNIIL